MHLDDALAFTAPPAVEAPTPEVPKGWERGIEWNGDAGTLTTGALDTEPTEPVWRELVADWGFDPELVEIVGPVRVKGWDSPVKGTETGETIRLRSYSVRIQHRTGSVDRADIDALCKQAAKRKPPRTTPTTANAERAMVVALSDFQVGKGEGDGSAGTVERITAASVALLDRLRDLKRIGRAVDVVYLVGMGDLVEGCDGHYAAQTFQTDLTRREQMMVVRRLIIRLVDMLTDAGYPVVLTGVAGNHGENRKDGKAYTTFEDNDDLAVIDQCAEVFAANPDRYAAVSVFVPDALSLALDCAGTVVGFTHGHTATRGADPSRKVLEWWKGQIVGNGPTASAQILVTGHYHHLLVNESMGRTHLQCPALDPGSRWWTEQTGQSSPPGLLTFCTGADYGARGYGDMAVL